MTTMTIAPPASASAEGGPLDLATSHKILFTAAAACEDDVLAELAAARQRGDDDAVKTLTAQRNLFDRLAVELRATAPAACARAAG